MRQRFLLQSLGQFMGDQIDHRHAADTDGAEKVDRVGLGFREDGHQYIARVDLFFATALHMGNRPLQDPVEGNSLGRVGSGGNGDGRDFARQKRLESVLQGLY